ncbi:MAG: protein L [Pseudomonas putida]|nr:MAG: protein L [Pseudomonas putida]
MSWYTNNSALTRADHPSDTWNQTFGPGQIVPASGIYRCVGCRKEITSNHGDPFPPQNHHQHSAQQGAVRWKMNVWTNTEGV